MSARLTSTFGGRFDVTSCSENDIARVKWTSSQFSSPTQFTTNRYNLSNVLAFIINNIMTFLFVSRLDIVKECRT